MPCWAWCRCPECAADVNDAIDPSLSMLLALRGEAAARRPPRRAREGVSGPALAPLRGRGMEYAESREYAVGDDARHMDWRVTARTGRPHTKLFQPERERSSWIVADRAPSLYFGTRARYKSVQAARLGAVAAWAALNDGDRIGAMCGSASEPPRMPAGGMRGVLPVMEALARWYSTPANDGHGLDHALRQMRRLVRPGSRVVVLAEATSVVAIDAARWRALAKATELHVLLPVDAFEQSPPRRRLRFLSAGARSEFDLSGSAVYGRWKEAFAETLQQALATIRDAGGDAQAIMTDASATDWLVGFRPAQVEVA
ncbi:MAG: DUF58 domain-containing protein [Proteobacteria bacterium]|nr:DUF58 domain-containing protein [Pseudomonadota bacterium]